MSKFRINAELYAAVIVAKRAINWDEYLTKPKKVLKIGYTIYPPERRVIERPLSVDEIRKKLGVATIRKEWDLVRKLIKDLENCKEEAPITKLRVVA